MSRMTLAVVLTLASMFVYPTDTYAKDGWWGWLEEFSGPGPFRTRNPLNNIHVSFACKYDEIVKVDPVAWGEVVKAAQPLPEGKRFDPTFVELVRNKVSNTLAEMLKTAKAQRQFLELPGAQPLSLTLSQTPRWRAFGTPFPASREFAPNMLLSVLNDEQRDRRNRNKNCWFIDYTRYIADADSSRGFPRIRAEGLDVGGTYFIGGPFDIGAAIGYVQFEPAGHEAIRRLTLTPLRLHIRPLWFVDPEKHFRAEWRWLGRLAYIPKLYVKLTAVPKSILGSEFGAPKPVDPGQEFQTKGELVTSYGVVFDLGEVLGWFGSL